MFNFLNPVNLIINRIKKMEDRIMTALENLQAAVDSTIAEDQKIKDGLTVVSAKVADLTKQVADLQAQIGSSGNNDVVLQAMADKLNTGVTDVQAALDAVNPPAAPAV